MWQNVTVTGVDFDQRAARKTARYQKQRIQFLWAHPLCAGCEKNRIVREAREIDHVIPASKAPELFWDTSNWQALCRACHENKTAAENAVPSPQRLAWKKRNKKLYDG